MRNPCSNTIYSASKGARAYEYVIMRTPSLKRPWKSLLRSYQGHIATRHLMTSLVSKYADFTFAYRKAALKQKRVGAAEVIEIVGNSR